MSIAAPSDTSLEAVPMTTVGTVQDSAPDGGAHGEARQFLQEYEDGLYWQQTNKLALASSMGSYHPPLVALCTEFRNGIHALRFATGETTFPPRSPATVPQQTDALVARMRAILDSVDEIHEQRLVGSWNADDAYHGALAEFAENTRSRFSSAFASLRSSLSFFS